MSSRFDDPLEIVTWIRNELEEAMWEHFSFLEVCLNAKNADEKKRIFTCGRCCAKFRRADGRKRHCDKQHGLLVCAFTPCLELFSEEDERDFHQQNDIHYCAICIKSYQGRRHRCYTRKPETQNTGDPDISSIADMGSPHSFRTASSPELSPGDFDASDSEFDSFDSDSAE